MMPWQGIISPIAYTEMHWIALYFLVVDSYIDGDRIQTK
jgi:hypothetical protein